MFIRISSLGAIVVAGLLFAGEVSADTTNDQSISGDSGSATQGAEAVSRDAKPKKKRKKKQKKICRREKVTGSHMRQRVCRTPEEEEARRRADQRGLNDLLATPATGQG